MEKKGSTGEKVVEIQRRLNSLGFGRLGLDGIFGPATEEAVERFQESTSLLVDGVVGPKTWKLLGRPSRSRATVLSSPNMKK